MISMGRGLKDDLSRCEMKLFFMFCAYVSKSCVWKKKIEKLEIRCMLIKLIECSEYRGEYCAIDGSV